MMPVTPPVTFMARVVVRASRDQHGGLGCSVGADGITRDMRSRELIDVLTTFQFPDGDTILQGARSMGNALVKLKTRPC